LKTPFRNYGKIFFILLSIIITFSFYSTFGHGAALNTTGANADPSAMLDISSQNSGLLIPRMTTLEWDNIASPASGLQIYNLTSQWCFELYENTVWQKMYCACSKPATPAGSTHMPTLNSIKWNWNAVAGADGYKANSTSDYSTATDVGNNTQFTQENENTGFSGIISIRGSQQDFLADDVYVFGSTA